ncbi:MAG: FG-GAP-like repeat-containing protein [Polyangiales bacterium]
MGTEYSGFRASGRALGDVRRDGFADVAFTDTAGFVHGDPSALIPPRVRVYLGGAGGLTAAPPVVLSSPLARDPGFGRVVAGPLDVDGDGLSDVVVDAWEGRESGGPTTRRVYVFRGHVDFDARAPSSTHAPRAGDARYSGQSFEGGGDVDGDGFDDLVLALDIPTGVLVQVARGGATGLAAMPSQSFLREGASVDDSSASAWGDITGDGLADIVLPMELPGGGVPATGRAVDAFWGRALPLDERPTTLR